MSSMRTGLLGVLISISLSGCAPVAEEDSPPANDGCDDANAQANPDAEEVCNEVDDDCDGEVDEGMEKYERYVDQDGDDYGAGEAVMRCERSEAGYSPMPGDCDDTDPGLSPSAEEVCDGVDQDCDGEVDLARVYVDQDGDGSAGTEVVMDLCDPLEDYAERFEDCDDTDSEVNPGAYDLCGDGRDTDCNGVASCASIELTAHDGSWSCTYDVELTNLVGYVGLTPGEEALLDGYIGAYPKWVEEEGCGGIEGERVTIELGGTMFRLEGDGWWGQWSGVWSGTWLHVAPEAIVQDTYDEWWTIDFEIDEIMEECGDED